MLTEKKLKITTGIISLGLFLTLVLKLKNVPGGMILSGLFLGLIALVGILLGCLIIALILKSIFKNYSFSILFLILTTVSFLIFHYILYSPTLKIIVPNSYRGEINLVLSNVKDNILDIDTNGIGYINQWTFNHTYSKPIIINKNGENIIKYCVGYNQLSFWGRGQSCCIVDQKIQTLNFEIVPREKIGQKQYNSKSVTEVIDTSLVLFAKPENIY